MSDAELTPEQKTHWREILQTNYLGAHDLKGKEPTVTIAGAKREEVFCPDTNKNKDALVVRFKGAKKPWIVNVTNSKRIAQHAGSEMIEDWVGTKITLITEKVKHKGEIKDAVRVKSRFGGARSLGEV